MYSPIGRNSAKQTDDAVDSNTNATTTSIPLDGAATVGFYVVAASGAHTTHITTLQISPDAGTTWIDSDSTITGIGALPNIPCISDLIRTKVTTAEGNASTVNITLVIK